MLLMTMEKTYLPRDGIARNGRDAAVPQPGECLDAGLDARVLRDALGRVVSLLLVREGVPFGDQPCADEQDVALARRHAEVSAHGLQRGEGDRVR
jgi:hypothetical protein